MISRVHARPPFAKLCSCAPPVRLPEKPEKTKKGEAEESLVVTHLVGSTEATVNIFSGQTNREFKYLMPVLKENPANLAYVGKCFRDEVDGTESPCEQE